MGMTVYFVNDFLTKSAINEAKSGLLSKTEILANQISPFMGNLRSPYTQRYLDDLIKAYSIENESRVLVINSDHAIVIDAFDGLVGESFIQHANFFHDEIGQITRSGFHEDESFVFAIAPTVYNNQHLGYIYVTTSGANIFDSVQEVIDILFIIASFAVIVSLVISVFFAQIISKPIESLTASIRQLSTGRYDTQVEVMGSDEIGELSEAFNLMITKLSQVEERRKKFVSNVSHELRTPMTSMKIVSDTLLSSPSWDEGVYREFMLDINSEVDRLNKIIDNLLYLVRLEKEEMNVEFKATYVNLLLEWVVKRISPLAQERKISIDLFVEEHVEMLIDQDKMQQCLLNIVGNAVKYTPDGGKVTLRLEKKKTELFIHISDTGIGIPEKDLPFIFDRFYRVDDSRARQTGGTGLGLAISQQIVQLHRGRVSVKSVLGEGTCVTIHLPRT